MLYSVTGQTFPCLEAVGFGIRLVFMCVIIALRLRVICLGHMTGTIVTSFSLPGSVNQFL